MGVKIISRSSQPGYATSAVDYATGNLNDWFTTTITVEVAGEIESSSTNIIQFNDDDTINLLNGDEWTDFAFEVGDTVNYAIDYVEDATNTPTNLTGSFTILAINGSLMDIDTDIFTTANTNLNFPGVFFISSNQYTAVRATLSVDKTFTAVEFNFNMFENSIYLQPTLNSIIDGNQNKFYAAGIDATDLVTNVPLIQQGFKSGGYIESATIKGGGKTSGVSTFILTLIHANWGDYDSISQLTQANNPPDWYAGAECLTDNYQFKFWKTAGNPNITLLSSLSDVIAQKQGNTGWNGENYNGSPSPYTLSSVTFQDVSANPLTELASYAASDMIITIEGQNFTTSSEFMMMLTTTPNDPAELQNSNITALALRTANSFDCENGTTYTDGTVVSTVTGRTNAAGSRVDVTSVDVDVQSATTVVITIRFSPDSNFTTEIAAKDSNDRKYSLTISCGDEGGVTGTSDRSNVVINDVWGVSPVIVEDFKAGKKWYPWELDAYTAPGTFLGDPPTMSQESDFHIMHEFDISNNDNIILDTIEFAVELHQISTGDRETLDSTTINVSGAPISQSGTQEISIDQSRAFNYLSDFKNNRISIERDPSSDIPPLRRYVAVFPYRLRYEWWLNNPTLNQNFYLASEPLNNLNNQWYTKQTNPDIEIRTFIRAVGTKNGVATTFETLADFNIVDYRDDGRYTRTIEVSNDSGFASINNIGTLQSGLYTGDLFAIDEAQDNYIRAIMSDGVADFSAHRYAEICIEVNEGGGWLTLWKIRSDQTPEANNPLQPISGATELDVTIATGSVTLQCKLDPDLLPADLEYKITANWAGTSNAGTPHEYYEREIAFGRIIRLAEPTDDENKGFDECCYETLVLADAVDTDSYKNDIKGLLFERGDSSFNIELFLVDSDDNEYALNDNTYGVFLNFGDLQNYPNYIWYQLEWQKVLQVRGAGKYRIKRINTEFGNQTTFISKCYKLLPYSIENANRTVRIESVMNGRLEETGIDYKGLNFVDHIRFDGKFGFRNPGYEEIQAINTDNLQTQIIQDLQSEYELFSWPLPECLTSEIFDFHLRGNLIFISDYNIDNHSYKFKSFPVHLVGSEKPKYFHNNRNARIFLTFDERVIAKRKSNCGERTLPTFSADFLISCEGGGGIVPSGIAYSRSKPTGQGSVYRTGDDKDNQNTGVYTYTPPANPAKVPQINYGASEPFFNITPSNSFNNGKRFTGETGGYYDEISLSFKDVNGAATTEALAFPNGYFIDHLTGLGWMRDHIDAGDTWNNAIDDAGTSTAHIYSDWRIPTIQELEDVVTDSTSFYNLPNLFTRTIGNSTQTWSCTTDEIVSTLNARVLQDTGDSSRKPKTSTTNNVGAYICRNHFT